MRSLSLAFLAFLIIAVVADESVPSDEAIRSMKIKELNAFLKERGLSCNACEKPEVVKMALENKHKPVLAVPRPEANSQDDKNKPDTDRPKPKPEPTGNSPKSDTKASKEPTPENMRALWAEKGSSICKSVSKGNNDAICQIFEKAVGEVFHSYVSTASGELLGGSPAELARKIYSPTHRPGANKALTTAIQSIMRDSVYDYEQQLNVLRRELAPWWLNIMLGKSAQMYDKDNIQELIREMEQKEKFKGRRPPPPPPRREKKPARSAEPAMSEEDHIDLDAPDHEEL
jgi:hypothetical protein